MSNRLELTPVQRAAGVERLADNIALCSGAGCGKTLVLARRFAELLKARTDLEDPLPNFVALTFTEKAALEMSQRVRRTLAEFASQAQGPERRRYRQWLEAIDQARISTIHGFCAGLLRAFAVEAGLDPAFTVCGEDDLMVQRLFAEAAEQAVLDAVEGTKGAAADAAAADLIERSSFDRVIEQVRKLASMRLECDLSAYIDPAATLRAWKQSVPRAQQAEWTASRAGEELPPLLEELEAIPCGDPGDRMAVVREELVRALRPALSGPRPPGAAAFDAVAAIDLRGGSARAWGGKDALDHVKKIVRSLRERMGELAFCGRSLNEADSQAAEDISVLARLAADVRGRYGRQKRSRGLLDFTDLLEHTGRILKDPAVASLVRSQIHQLLLDEAQDTDAFQIQMIGRLLFGEPAGAGPEGARPLPPGRLFLVGDPKQSIYRFRGARVEVFADLCRRLGRTSQLYLDLSFRSHRQTVAFVNFLFSRMMGGDYARIEASRQSIPPKESVEILLAACPEEGDFEDARSASRAEAAVAAQRVADMVRGGERLVWDGPAKDWRPARWGDIAILFSRMSNSLRYERELAEREVPYYVVAGTGFFQQQEVMDVLNALSAVDNPFDDVALFGALRSGLFGLDDNVLMHISQACEPPYFQKLAGLDLAGRLSEGQRRILAFAAGLLGELHRRKDACPIDRLLERLLDETGYEALLLAQPGGRRMAGNVRRLAELAKPGAAGPVSLAEFLAQMSERVVEEVRFEQAAVVAEAENVVRLMTIHKAKGLEFPVVVLPDLSGGGKTFREAMLCRDDLGLTYKPTDRLPRDGEAGDAGDEGKPLAYALAKRMETRDLRKEDIRRLYVAATRAMDHLVFVGADWRMDDGRFLQAGGHLSMMGEHLDLAGCADGGGRLEYEDAGRKYRAVVRKVAPVSPPPTRTRPPGARLLRAARGPEDLADSLLAAAGKVPAPPLLGPLPAEVASVEVAVTALADFERCPMLYRWRYELGVPTRFDAGIGVGRTPTATALAALDAAQLGTFFHRCMELLDFARPQSAGRLARLAAEDLQMPEEIDRGALAEEFRPMLEMFLKHPLGRQLSAAGRRLTELEFLLQEGPLRLGGKIDLLWQDGGGDWHIVDYKSDRAEGAARRPPAGADLAGHARRYELQMTAYALAASRHLESGRGIEAGGAETFRSRRAGAQRPPVVDATVYFLRLGEAQALPMEAEGLRAASDRLTEVSRRLIAARRTGEFPPCRTAACTHCPYRRYCEASGEAL